MTTLRKSVSVSVFAKSFLGAGLVWLGGLSGCDNLNERFTGLWLIADENEAAPPWLSEGVILALGHYGPDLTGVVHFRDLNGLRLSTCACTFFESSRVDASSGRLSGYSKGCNPDETVIWQLSIEDEEEPAYLQASVSLASSPQARTTFRLIRSQEFVATEWRACTP